MGVERDCLIFFDPSIVDDTSTWAECVNPGLPAVTTSIKFWHDESFDEYLRHCQEVNGGIWFDLCGKLKLFTLKSSREYDEPYDAFQRFKDKWFPAWLRRLWPVKTRKMVEYSFEVKPE